MLEENCSMEMSNSAYLIKDNIMKAYMHKKQYIPEPLQSLGLQYALYDKDKEVIYSNLLEDVTDFSQEMYESERYAYHIVQIKDDQIPIKYIAIETCIGIDSKKELKFLMMGILFLSGVFVSGIAYLLAKLLLRPVREKIEHMDQFIKDSAHELNTPVSVLLTSVSTLRQGRNPEKMMKYILGSTKQISQVYNDIHYSAFQDIDESLEEEFNLCELIRETSDFFFDIANAKDIVIEKDLDLLSIRMDKTKTQKIINNLLSNAVKYSNRGTKILVTLKDGIFSVEDHGIGISEEEQKNIFKRYKRGKGNNEGGFGIGLDIVTRIIHEYQLSLHLTSEVKKGSTFSVDFNSIKV